MLCGRGVSTAPREKESPASLLSAASERKLAGPQERLIIFYCVNVGHAAGPPRLPSHTTRPRAGFVRPGPAGPQAKESAR